MLLSMQKEEEEKKSRRKRMHAFNQYNDIKQDCDALYTTRQGNYHIIFLHVKVRSDTCTNDFIVWSHLKIIMAISHSHYKYMNKFCQFCNALVAHRLYKW